MSAAESITPDFSFQLDFVNEANQVVRAQQLSQIDFGQAIRETSFDAFRQGLVETYQPLPSEIRIEPVFPNAGSSSPQAKGFCVTIPVADGREHRCEFDIAFFRPAANRLRAELLRTKAMTNEQELYFRLNAFLDDQEPLRPANKLSLSLGPPTANIPVAAGVRRDFGPVETWDGQVDTDLPVLIEQLVLDEAVAEARGNPEREVAGFLLGQMMRDERRKEVFIAVTGLASAYSTTEATAASVTYTPASFAQVRNIIKLRARGESVIGWYHSHPFKLCAECPLPTPPECIAKVLFYSQDDIHLMETTFEQPFMVGLLSAVEPRIEAAVGHLPVKLYGWRNGEIKERGFDVVQAAR
jgi:proteasome lid subunit RPN8/RPN11